MLTLVLDEINGLDDVNMVQCRRNAKFGGEFLDVFLFRFILASFSKLFDGVQLLLTTIPLMGETDDRGSTLADSYLLTNSILFRQAPYTVTCSRLAVSIRITLLATAGRSL